MTLVRRVSNGQKRFADLNSGLRGIFAQLGPITSNQNLGNDTSRKLVGQSFIETVPMVNEISIIHAEEMKDRGMKIMNADAILYGLVAQVIRRSLSTARL